MKSLEIKWKAHQLSLVDALHQAVDLITRHYGSNWIASHQARDVQKSEWSDAANAQFEVIQDPHSHSYMELCVSLDGGCMMQHGEDWLRLSAGEVCLLIPGIIHNEMPDKLGPYKAIWLAADSKQVVVHVFVRDYSQDLLLFEGNKFEYDLNLQSILDHLKPNQNSTEPRQVDLIKTYVMQLLLYTLRKLGEAPIGGRSEHWKTTVVKEIYEYVEKHHNRHIRLSEISQEQCISINHLNNLFKAATGKTIVRYIEENRMDKAKRWLHEGDDSVQAIASRLGFYDPYHFSKTFKKETGLTPTQYRKSKEDVPGND